MTIETPMNKTYTKYYSNGQKKSQISLIPDEEKYWYENGCIKETRTYDGGQVHQEFYENGNLKKIVSCKDKLSKSYFENGNKESRIILDEMCSETSEQIWWMENGCDDIDALIRRDKEFRINQDVHNRSSDREDDAGFNTNDQDWGPYGHDTNFQIIVVDFKKNITNNHIDDSTNH